MIFSVMRVVGLVQLFTSTFVFALLLYLGRRSKERREAMLAISTGELSCDDIEAQQQLNSAHLKHREMMDSWDLKSDRGDADDDEAPMTRPRDILIDNMDLIAGLSVSHLASATVPRPLDAADTMGSLLSSTQSENHMEGPCMISAVNDDTHYPAQDIDVEQQLLGNEPLRTAQRGSTCEIASATATSILVGCAMDETIRTRKSFSKQRVFI